MGLRVHEFILGYSKDYVGDALGVCQKILPERTDWHRPTVKKGEISSSRELRKVQGGILSQLFSGHVVILTHRVPDVPGCCLTGIFYAFPPITAPSASLAASSAKMVSPFP